MFFLVEADDDEYVPPKPEVVEVKEDDAFFTVKWVTLEKMLTVWLFCLFVWKMATFHASDSISTMCALWIDWSIASVELHRIG